MQSFYEEVPLTEIDTVEEISGRAGKTICYPCPCGDTFLLSLEAFAKGSSIAECPSCSLTIFIQCTDEERAAFVAKHSSQ